MHLRSEPTSHSRENQNKEKERLLKTASSQAFPCNASLKQEF